jgi:glycosyltransferase involved in cell wall biosynthesis
MALVSIITPLHNKGLYIAETIQSVLDQTHPDWEMLIIDNLSTDDGFEIAKQFGDPRLRFLTNDVPGPGSTRNVGLDAATGEWLLYLDADDLLESGYLSIMLRTAQENPETEIVATSWKEFQSGAPTQNLIEKQPARVTKTGFGLEAFAIAHTCWAIHAAIVKRDWLGEIRWPVELDGHLAEDTAYWFRVVTGANVSYTSNAGALYRTQTVGCRSDYSPEAWFQGNHQAMLSNLDFLEGQGRSPSAEQIESLIRLYSSLFMNAQRGGDKKNAKLACCEATMWLGELKQLGGASSVSMRLRSILGLKTFEKLRKITILLRPNA